MGVTTTGFEPKISRAFFTAATPAAATTTTRTGIHNRPSSPVRGDTTAVD
jgi:hypothetical protein